MIGIPSLMLPAHISVWYPLYGGGHMSSTAVIAFIIIPGYCMVTGAVGVLIGWLITFLPWFKDRHITN
jgi:hypothetical protein